MQQRRPDRSAVRRCGGRARRRLRKALLAAAAGGALALAAIPLGAGKARLAGGALASLWPAMPHAAGGGSSPGAPLHGSGAGRDGAPAAATSQRRRTLEVRARAGDTEAQYALARLLLAGAPPPPAAFYWLSKAAEQGHAGAQHALGTLLVEGRGIEADPQEGRRWLERARATRGAEPAPGAG